MKTQSTSIARKFVGLLLILIAATGVLLSLAGAGLVWRMKDVLSAEVSATLDQLSETLTYVDQSVDMLSKTLDSGLESVDQLDASVQAARTTLETTNHFFDTAAELTGKTLPDALTSIQGAFESAGKSAKVVDDTLNFIASLPLVGGDYAPTVPMSEAMNKVARDIEPLAGTIKGIEDDVLEVQGDMLDFRTRLDEANGQIQRIQESATEARQAINQTKGVVAGFSPRLQLWREKFPQWIKLASYGICVYLLWVAVAQLGLFVQGISMLFDSGRPRNTNTGDLPAQVHSGGSDFGDRAA